MKNAVWKREIKKSNEGREITLRAEQERKQLCSLSLGDIEQVKTRTLCPKKKKKKRSNAGSVLLFADK